MCDAVCVRAREDGVSYSTARERMIAEIIEDDDYDIDDVLTLIYDDYES